jgi:hypothetical protein
VGTAGSKPISGFEPIWRVSFVSRLAAEERCRLKDLAMEDGAPRYVTAVSSSTSNRTTSPSRDLSRFRDENKMFSGLPLGEKLHKHKVGSRRGLLVIDLKSGDTVHWLDIKGVVSEPYDMAALPSVQRSMAIGFKTDEIRRVVMVGER